MQINSINKLSLILSDTSFAHGWFDEPDINFILLWEGHRDAIEFQQTVAAHRRGKSGRMQRLSRVWFQHWPVDFTEYLAPDRVALVHMDKSVTVQRLATDAAAVH